MPVRLIVTRRGRRRWLRLINQARFWLPLVAALLIVAVLAGVL